MAFLINTSGTVYSVIESLTYDVTGSLALTFVLLLFFFVLIAFIFRLNIELTALVLTPLVFILGLSDNTLYPILVIWLIFLGGLFAKNIFFMKN